MAQAPTGISVSSASDRVFPLGPFPLACGETLDEARLHCREYGTPNRDRSHLVLMPSSYSAWPEDLDWVMGTLFDPERHWLVLVSQFGNGRSSSPSNGGPPLGPGGWPVDHRDNLRAQMRLLEERFRVECPALVYGWSMGAQQAYHWAVLEPDRPRRRCCVCGTARTTPHNRLFLLSLRRALTGDPA
jgi:homoserine O-acetyltransferase